MKVSMFVNDTKKYFLNLSLILSTQYICKKLFYICQMLLRNIGESKLFSLLMSTIYPC